MKTHPATTFPRISPLRHCRFLFLLLAGILLLSSPAGAQVPSEKIRVSLAPEGEVKVGQRVTLSIELMTTARFSGSPGFDIPDIPGVIALKLNTFGINSTETADGVTYSVQGHEFALFAQRPGKRVIEPFDVRFYPTGPGAAPPREVTLKTEPLTLDAVMPPGAEGLSTLICTEGFDLTEAWDPPPEEARVGDAFTRRITMRADDVPGMAFPPLEVPDIRSVGIYPKEPLVNDKTDRGDFTGERTETITYVCEDKGTVTFPEVTVHWWDLKNDSLQVKTLPAVTLKVKANPSLLTGTDAPLPLSSWNRAVPWLLFSGIVLALCVVAAVKYRATLGERFIAWRQGEKCAEKTCFKAIKTACRAKDPAATYAALLAWIEALPNRPGSLTPALISDITQNPPLAEQANRLQRQLFQSPGSQGAPWDAAAFFKALCTSRRRLLKKEKTKASKNGLPGLNPS